MPPLQKVGGNPKFEIRNWDRPGVFETQECLVESGVLRIVLDEFFQGGNQLWQIVMDDSPQDIQIYCKVTVDQPIAHGDDLVPGNLRCHFQGGFRKTAGRFTYDLNETLQSTHKHGISVEDLARLASRAKTARRA